MDPIDSMFTDDKDIISINDSTNSISFNASITPRTISILNEKLLLLEDKIIKNTTRVKRKLKNLNNHGKNDKDKDNKDKYTLDDSDDEFVTITVEPKPIKLYITSNGGYVYQVFSAIDTIQSLRVPVHTICKGFVASAGTLLSLAGKKRFITENSYMLIHELRTGSWGKYTHISESFENSKKLMEHIKQYYVKKTKMTIEFLDEQLKKDLTWNAEMCLEHGLVDEIIKF